MANPDSHPGSGASESDLPDGTVPGTMWATEEEVNALEAGDYFDRVAFDVGEGEKKNLIFPDPQSRENYVAQLNNHRPRDMTFRTNWPES